MKKSKSEEKIAKRGSRKSDTSTDPAKMKAWLDKTTEGPWTVYTAPPSNKRKRDAPKMDIEDRLFEDKLKVQYEVRPRERWEALKLYKKFTVAAESIAIGDCILVGHSESSNDEPDAEVDLADQWKAVVLEVRALDSEHVYLRVGWLNRPEDLDSGRKDYHGENELIPTNQMDVIDAMTVNGKIDVIHWDENDTDAQMANENQFFWRQTYDYMDKTFSKLRQICKDNRPQNPDEMIIECPNEGCRKWLHANCVVEQAAKSAAEEASGKAKSNTPKKRQPRSVYTGSNRPPAAATASKGNFTAELFLSSPPNTEPDEISVRPAATKPEIVITDPKGEKQAQDLYCLCCSKPIE